MIYVQWRMDGWIWGELLMGAYFLRPVENALADDRSIIKKRSGTETWHPSVFIIAEIIVLLLFAAVTLAAALIRPTFYLFVPLVLRRFQEIAHILHGVTRYKPKLFARQGNDCCLHVGLCPPPLAASGSHPSAPTSHQHPRLRMLLCNVALTVMEHFLNAMLFHMIIPSVWQMTGYICKSLHWETIVGQHVG